MLPWPPTPTDAQLQRFRWIGWPLTVVVVAGLLGWRVGVEAALVVTVPGALLALVVALSRTAARAVFLGVAALTLPIGWLLTHAALVALYVLIVTPLGWLLRLAGWDPLADRRPDAASYWVERPPAPPPEDYTHLS